MFLIIKQSLYSANSASLCVKAVDNDLYFITKNKWAQQMEALIFLGLVDDILRHNAVNIIPSCLKSCNPNLA